MLADGDDVWLSYKRPVQVAGDPRPYVAYYIRRFGLAQPSQPSLGPAINVPGELLEIENASPYGVISTRDLVWGPATVDTALARLRLYPGVAMLESHRSFPDQLVEAIRLDGTGHVLVSHRTAWSVAVQGDTDQKLTVLDANAVAGTALAEVPIDTWATLQGAQAGRGLFQVPGGLLVLNLDDPHAPYPQAFFPTRGWPRRITLDGRTIVAPAGRYGIYAFDLDAFNLLDL
jgi:hypothetical protein